MFEIADRLLARLDAGEPLAVATAVSIDGSAPRTVGTSMAVTADGTVIGSISGGCVEGAVYEISSQVLDDGAAQLETFGFSDETAFEVGLSCGGRIEVLTRLVTPDDAVTIAALREAAAGREATAHVVLGPIRTGEVVASIDDCDGLRVFSERSAPPPRLLVFGAVEFAVALCDAGAVLGYRVTVCDPRPVFLTRERFPSADEIVVEWPPHYLARTEVDDRTVIAVLSHDERFDADLVEVALASPAAYVGAMGSRTTHDRRIAALRERSVDDAALDRLHSPIGLDLGASTPEETAVSIMAEVLAVRSGATRASLRDRGGSIHLTA
ncbi:XdhC family protein [Frigoribacterium faeni]|uniref:Xanthine dehydrogenase n=1 Tax=Frigoribacterium faeni TaxID=145483 RepID=A0A7W3JJ06_9MICO|nr:XdhC family protein [Frigoribacterium faeni]MBA8813752.1 xanthine dehydrogenase accessory factor [Frigoribacterium faeni]BFF15056.1 XdhC family protein [Microbacterium flavescens]GEK84746.1 xanthine dehydrogenase [Frigoribacterium faeni]